MTPRQHFETTVELGRKKHGWTLEEVAKKLDVSLSTVQSWLKPAAVSRREPPSWAIYGLSALLTGKPATERRGALTITYAPATTAGRP